MRVKGVGIVANPGTRIFLWLHMHGGDVGGHGMFFPFYLPKKKKKSPKC